MMNFYQMCQLLDEAIEPNPTFGHSNNPKNRRVVDYGAHLDNQLLDKSTAVSSRRADADYSQDPQVMQNPAEKLSSLPDGDTARLIFKAINNSRQFQHGSVIPVDNFISMLQKEKVMDSNGPVFLGNLNRDVLHKALFILSQQDLSPIDVTKNAKGQDLVSVKSIKPNAANLQRQMAKQNAGTQAKQAMVNPDEDQLALPGEGGRYSSIKANLAPAGNKVPDQIKTQIVQLKQSFDKAFDVAMHAGTGASMNQAAKAYMAILQKYAADPSLNDTAKATMQKEAQRVQQAWQQFVSQWGIHNVNPQSGV